MSNSHFLSNIPYGRGGQSMMNMIFQQSLVLLNKNLKRMMVMVNTEARKDGSFI